MGMWTVAVAVGAILGATPASFDQFFRDFAEKRQGIKSLTAVFKQTSVVPEETLEVDGEITYVEPRRIIYQTGNPYRVTLVDQDRVYEYEPEIKQVAIYNLAERGAADAFFLGFDSDAERLQRQFNTKFFEIDDDARGGIGLELTPKDPESALFQWVKLYLDEARYLPYRIHIQNEEDSETIIDVSSFELNPTLDPTETQISIPPGTVMVEDDQFIEEIPEGNHRFIPEPIGRDAASKVQVAPLGAPEPSEEP